jgi:hypothetical protein
MSNLKVIEGRPRLDQAYIELEPDVCDLVRAGELISLVEAHGDSGLLTYAIEQFDKNVKEFKQKYYKLYKG